MKTKLILEIEIDETLDQTSKIWNDCIQNGKVKIKDIFNSNAEAFIKFKMITRGK